MQAIQEKKEIKVKPITEKIMKNLFKCFASLVVLFAISVPVIMMFTARTEKGMILAAIAGVMYGAFLYTHWRKIVPPYITRFFCSK